MSLQALLWSAPLRRTYTEPPWVLRVVCHVFALGVFYMLESGGVDSALARVALLDADLLPSPSRLLTLALLPVNVLHFGFVCVLLVERVSDACSNWR